jgi:hypothetical protein
MKYITPDGGEKTLNSKAEVDAAIRMGLLGAGTMVLDEALGRWVKAHEHVQLHTFFTGAAGHPPPASDHEDAGGLRAAAWFVWLFGCLAFPVIAVSMGVDARRAGAFIIQDAFGWGAACAIGFIFARKPRSRALVALVTGCLLCFAWLTLMLQSIVVHGQGQRQAAQNLRRALESRAVPQGGDPAPVRTPGSFGFGAAGVMNVMADYVRQMKRMGDEYQQARVAFDIQSQLSPATLLDKTQLRAADARLDAWDHFLVDQERGIGQARQDMVSRIAGFQTSASARQGVLEKLQASKAGADESLRRIFELEHSINSEIRTIHAFTGRRIGLVPIHGGKMQLGDVELAAFKAHFDHIHQLSAEETKVREALSKMDAEATQRLQQIAQDAAR